MRQKFGMRGLEDWRLLPGICYMPVVIQFPLYVYLS